jgi:hypothetical protein
MNTLVGLRGLGHAGDDVGQEGGQVSAHLAMMAAMLVCSDVGVHVGPVVALGHSFFGFSESILSR